MSYLETMMDQTVEFPLPQGRDYDLVFPELLCEEAFNVRLSSLFRQALNRDLPLSVIIMSGQGPKDVSDPEVMEMGKVFVNVTNPLGGLRGRVFDNRFTTALLGNNVFQAADNGLKLVDKSPQAYVGVSFFNGESDSFTLFMQQAHRALFESRKDFNHRVAILVNGDSPLKIKQFPIGQRDRIILVHK